MPLPLPLDRTTHHLLREAVLALREAEPRTRFPTALHVGVPGGRTLTHLCDGLEDEALATDVVAAMLQRLAPEVPDPLVWLTRAGHLSLHDDDVRWAAPVERAHQQAGRRPRFVVVTRDGWRDPRTGALQQWRRLRRHTVR